MQLGVQHSSHNLPASCTYTSSPTTAKLSEQCAKLEKNRKDREESREVYIRCDLPNFLEKTFEEYEKMTNEWVFPNVELVEDDDAAEYENECENE